MKFREFVTSSGKKVLAGKDEDSNEDLVKQAAPDEFVLHTATAGSPFVNIKGKADDEDIKEAAVFCAKYSRDWKKNKTDVEVHAFYGRDVYKIKAMPVGTFGVKRFKVVKVKKKEIEKL